VDVHDNVSSSSEAIRIDRRGFREFFENLLDLPVDPVDGVE
jgi:hypothetical protein